MSELSIEAQKARYEALSDEDKRFFDPLMSMSFGRYDVDADLMLKFHNLFAGSLISGFNAIYALGFIKGQRAEKARAKKRAKEANARAERYKVPCDEDGQVLRACINHVANRIGDSRLLERGYKLMCYLEQEQKEVREA